MTAKKLILEELIKGRNELQAQLDELKDAIAFLDVCITTGFSLAASMREHEEDIPEEIIDIPETEPVYEKCLNCGNIFLTNHVGLGFCTNRCAMEFDSKKEKENNPTSAPINSEPEPIPQPEVKHCLNCGKEFIPHSPKQLYCSRECNNDFNHKRRKDEEKKKIFGSKNTDLDAKLAQIKATCPAPTKRPNIQRDI